jgi:hypothetical protein
MVYTSSGIIESNNVPACCHDRVTPYLWLMLASGAFLDTVTNNMLPPLYDGVFPLQLEKDLRNKVIWSRLDGPPRLPKEIHYINDGFLRNYNSKTRKMSYQSLHNIVKPYTNASFMVKGVTNVGNMTIPLNFLFEEYRRIPTPPFPFDISKIYPVATRIEASIKRVSKDDSKESFLPTISRQDHVVYDRRLRHAKPSVLEIQYFVRDRKWPTIKQVLTDYKYGYRKRTTNP